MTLDRMFNKRKQTRNCGGDSLNCHYENLNRRYGLIITTNTLQEPKWCTTDISASTVVSTGSPCVTKYWPYVPPSFLSL